MRNRGRVLLYSRTMWPTNQATNRVLSLSRNNPFFFYCIITLLLHYYYIIFFFFKNGNQLNIGKGDQAPLFFLLFLTWFVLYMELGTGLQVYVNYWFYLVNHFYSLSPLPSPPTPATPLASDNKMSCATPPRHCIVVHTK